MDTDRIIKALRKAAGSARCAEDANELNALADELDVEAALMATAALVAAPPGDEPTPVPSKKRAAKDEA